MSSNANLDVSVVATLIALIYRTPGWAFVRPSTEMGEDVVIYYEVDELDIVPSGPWPLETRAIETLDAATRAVERQLLTSLLYCWYIYRTQFDPSAVPASIVDEYPSMATPIDTTPPPAPRRRTVDLPEIDGEPRHIPSAPSPGYVPGLQVTGILAHTPATEPATNHNTHHGSDPDFGYESDEA